MWNEMKIVQKHFSNITTYYLLLLLDSNKYTSWNGDDKQVENSCVKKEEERNLLSYFRQIIKHFNYIKIQQKYVCRRLYIIVCRKIKEKERLTFAHFDDNSDWSNFGDI